MQKILILFLLFFAGFLAVVFVNLTAGGNPDLPEVVVQENEEEKCISPIVIDTIKIADNLAVLDAIRRCIEERGEAIAYVNGKGGEVDEALAFFDLMRTSGLSKNTTFIATATIWSASNIVWLSAETRIVLPGSQFIVHSATYNMTSETRQIREESAENTIDSTIDAVGLATGKKGADLWEKSIQGLGPGAALNATQALEFGWATEIRGYESAPKN